MPAKTGQERPVGVSMEMETGTIVMNSRPILRSLLFVPGVRPDFLPKARAAGADALILDLEDSVPPDAKEAARSNVRAWLAESPGRPIFVRFNQLSLGDLDKDLSVLAPHGSQVLMIPKVEHAQDLHELDGRLSSFESARGLAPDAVKIVIVIESSLGLRNLYGILHGARRVCGAALASAEQGDLIVDLGAQWTPTGEALTYARGKFVCDARAAKIPWLIDGAFMNIRNPEALRAEAVIARAHGFSSKVAIHPGQVATINEVFSPTVAEIAWARALLDAFREAEGRGHGATQFQGGMVDYANVKWAERILELAAAIQS